MKIILDYNRTIFDPESGKLYPGVLELLQRISKKHELFLVSKYEPGRQNTLRELGIDGLFKKIAFVDDKAPELFLELVDGDKNVLVAGDRVRGEIRVGNALGFITVWVRQGKFVPELPSSPSEEPRYSIGNIIELENIISIYEQ